MSCYLSGSSLAAIMNAEKALVGIKLQIVIIIIIIHVFMYLWRIWSDVSSAEVQPTLT